MNMILKFSLILAIGLSWTGASLAQTDEGAATEKQVVPTIRQVDEKELPEIRVDFELKLPDDTPMLDAEKKDIQVEEDGKPVEILQFFKPEGAKEVRPTTLVLVLDRSGSMKDENRIEGLKAAVATFLEMMPAGSKVAVVSFSSDIRIHDFDENQTFSNDVASIRTDVNSLSANGATRYYDAVASALNLLGEEKGRRAILALTDGEDTFSQSFNIDSAILLARRLGLPIYTLGLGSEEEIKVSNLKRLALETRGQYFHARNVDRLRVIYEEIAKSLGNTYSLTYKTDRNLPDGTLRPVKLTYKHQASAEKAYFVEGMVVPAAGWSWLMLMLLGCLGFLAWLPLRKGSW